MAVPPPHLQTMLYRAKLLALATAAVVLPTAGPAFGFETWIDLNTYVKGREGGQ